MIAKTFPVHHIRKGQETNFAELIEKEIKKHTLRANYQLWKKRADEINQGIAYLSVRQWSGKPYASNQVELFQQNRLLVEKLQMTPLGWFIEDYDSDYTTVDIASNDGLDIQDFYSWFKGKITIDMDPMAIIHFTDFTYSNIKNK
jgi:hypothetical protein